jgi:hypothetical protein
VLVPCGTLHVTRSAPNGLLAAGPPHHACEPLSFVLCTLSCCVTVREVVMCLSCPCALLIYTSRLRLGWAGRFVIGAYALLPEQRGSLRATGL